MGPPPGQQVFARPRLQVIVAAALARFFFEVAEFIGPRGVRRHVVKLRRRLNDVAKGRVRGDVVDAFAAHVDLGLSPFDVVEILLTGSQHDVVTLGFRRTP